MEQKENHPASKVDISELNKNIDGIQNEVSEILEDMLRVIASHTELHGVTRDSESRVTARRDLNASKVRKPMPVLVA